MLINKILFSAADAASILDCCSAKVYGLIKTKQLAAYKDKGGHDWHITDKAILSYVKGRMVEQAQVK